MATKPSRSDSGAAKQPAKTRAKTASVRARTAARSSGGDRVTADVYNAFIAGVDLVSVRLAGAEIRAGSTPERKQLLPAVEQASGYVNEEGHVLITHELTFTGRYEGGEEPAVRVRAEFEVRYSSSERMTDEIFAEFRRRNLPLNTWPYFREFVHAALARTGWPVLVLPVYKAVGAPLSPAAE